MKTAVWTDLRFLLAVSGTYPLSLCAIVVISTLAFVFDWISIGMLVPLLADLQKASAPGVVSGPFQWLAQISAIVPEEWRVYAFLGLIIVAVVFKNVLVYLGIRMGHQLSSGMTAEIRRAQVRRLLSAGLGFHERSKPAELLDRVVRHNDELEVLIRFSIEFIANAMTLAALLALLFALSWRLALIAACLGGLSVLCGLVYSGGLSRLGTEEANAARAISVRFHEALAAIKLIKSWSTEERHLQWLDHDIESAVRASFRRTFYGFAIHPITDVTATIALAVILLASLWLHGGDVRLMLVRTLPFTFVLLRMVPILKILNGQKAIIFSRWPYLHSTADLLRADVRPTIHDGDELFHGLTREIRLAGVSFTYRGRPRPALSSVNLVIPAGKTTAIIGESGSGKSTLVNLILRLYDAQAGTISIDDKPLTNLQLESYHRRIASVSQDTYLFHQTVRFNIAYGAGSPPSDERLIEAARQACAHDFIVELPDGYDTVIGDRGVQLSGGQRQRLALARAIVVDPEILILDEATSALDAETERAIQQALTEFGHGRTVIVIAHRLSTIRDADQVVVFKDGQVVEVRSGHRQHRPEQPAIRVRVRQGRD